MRARIGVVAVVATAASVMALAACTPSKGSSSTQSGGGAAATGGTAAATGASSSDTLSVATDTPPDDWNPADATPADPNMLYYQAPYDFLINTDNTGKLVPGLATKWVVAPTSVTLTLRSGVKFTDGTPFDANAVKVNIENFQKNGIPPNQAKFRNVTSIDVVSPTVVRLNLAHPTPQLPDNLARQQGLMASPKAIQNDPKGLKTDPVGTGGWILDTKATVPNSKYVFHANPNYWNKSAQGFKNIIIYYIPDEQARTNALLTHKVDWINYDAQFKSKIKAAGFQTNTAPGFPYYLVILDRKGKLVPAFKNVKVRQAMAYAMDRSGFMKIVEAGDGTPSAQWMIPGFLGNDATFTGMSYNLAKAKQLMKESGVKPFTFTVPSYGPFDVRNEAIAGFLSKIGITMKLETAQTGNISGAAASGKYAAAVLPSHDIHPEDFYHDYIFAQAPKNPFHDAVPAVDAMMAKVTGNDAADEPLYNQMATYVADQGIVISLGVIGCGGAWDGAKITGVTDWYWTCTDVRFAGIKAK